MINVTDNHFMLDKLDKLESILKSNKKVLLSERKRHTTHRVASARCAALSREGVPTMVFRYLSWSGVPTADKTRKSSLVVARSVPHAG